MGKKILLLIIVSFSVAVGGFWALRAQDPPQTPAPVRAERQARSAQTVQTDLSGTYTGTFDCEALGLTGDTTLTITGNEFTTADGKTGRIVASTTGGYTAVALQTGGTAATATTPATAPTIVSLRARKIGSRLTLTSVSGTTMKCSFVTGRSVARGKRTPRTPAATGTEVAAPATVPVPTESPMPSQTPSPTPTPSPNPSPEPEPVPSPTPSGSPTPAPSPSPGEPTPSPTPAPSPTPTPSPTPSPSPRRAI